MIQFQNSLTLRMGEKEAEENIKKALERIGLAKEISISEIKKELSEIETPFQSLLLLGILKRIMAFGDKKAGELYIPAILTLINFVSRKDLGGMSPQEHLKKFPLGQREWNFVNQLIEEYNQRLMEKQSIELAKIEEDFQKFQKEFLERIPSVQPFLNEKGKFQTIKEIIAEERKKNGWPKELSEKIGLKVFLENIPEFLGLKVAQIEDNYFQVMEELEEMKINPRLRNKSRIHQIKEILAFYEPYFRASDIAHQFYLNYAMVSLVNGEKLSRVLTLLDKSLSFDPTYELALEMKERLTKSF